MYIQCFWLLFVIIPEISKGGERFDAVLFGQSFVVDFHEINTERIGVVVDFLELGKDLVACDTTASICGYYWNVWISCGSFISLEFSFQTLKR